MALTNEDLLAISRLLDGKLQPVKVLLENEVLPRLDHIEACYTSTCQRYASGIEEISAMRNDMDVTKRVLTEHSEKLQKLA